MKVGRDGWIQLPADVLKKYGVQEGGIVEVCVNGIHPGESPDSSLF